MDAFKKTCLELLEMLEEDEASGHRMDLEKAIVYSQLLEDQDLALEAAWKAYQERPANIDVNRVLADIHIRAGKPGKAKEFLKAAERTNSRNPELLELKDALALN